MRVLGVRARGEADGLVAGSEVDIEPCDDRVNEIIPAGIECEGYSESQIGSCAGVEIER
jgi:hypothetical protein